jgi:hypothetical protein
MIDALIQLVSVTYKCFEMYVHRGKKGPTIGENKLHTLIIVIGGGNYTYIYKIYINTMFLVNKSTPSFN